MNEKKLGMNKLSNLPIEILIVAKSYSKIIQGKKFKFFRSYLFQKRRKCSPKYYQEFSDILFALQNKPVFIVKFSETLEFNADQIEMI